MYDEFFGIEESEQYAFYRVPKLLFTSNRFHNLSTDAKMLYGLFLDRMALSQRNGWIAVIRRGLPVESERDHGISPARHWIVRGGDLLKNASLPAPPPLQKLLTGGEETHREFSFYLWFIRLCPHSAK